MQRAASIVSGLIPVPWEVISPVAIKEDNMQLHFCFHWQIKSWSKSFTNKAFFLWNAISNQLNASVIPFYSALNFQKSGQHSHFLWREKTGTIITVTKPQFCSLAAQVRRVWEYFGKALSSRLGPWVQGARSWWTGMLAAHPRAPGLESSLVCILRGPQPGKHPPLVSELPNPFSLSSHRCRPLLFSAPGPGGQRPSHSFSSFMFADAEKGFRAMYWGRLLYTMW